MKVEHGIHVSLNDLSNSLCDIDFAAAALAAASAPQEVYPNAEGTSTQPFLIYNERRAQILSRLISNPDYAQGAYLITPTNYQYLKKAKAAEAALIHTEELQRINPVFNNKRRSQTVRTKDELRRRDT